MGEPSDEDIEASLRAVPDERWVELWAAWDALEREDVHTTWDTSPGHLPYASYSEAVERALAALAGVGGVVPFDWMNWDGGQRYPAGQGLDEAPVTDALRLTTAVIRGERFFEGTIATALEDGALAAIVQRLRRWVEEER